jgi:hypothetical protein
MSSQRKWQLLPHFQIKLPSLGWKLISSDRQFLRLPKHFCEFEILSLTPILQFTAALPNKSTTVTF